MKNSINKFIPWPKIILPLSFVALSIAAYINRNPVWSWFDLWPRNAIKELFPNSIAITWDQGAAIIDVLSNIKPEEIKHSKNGTEIKVYNNNWVSYAVWEWELLWKWVVQLP